jgi:hypothetical protein
MKIAWVHSFSEKMQSSGIFMYILADELRSQGIDIKFINI